MQSHFNREHNMIFFACGDVKIVQADFGVFKFWKEEGSRFCFLI